MVAEHVQPPLTAVKLPFREMGREAARILTELIDGQPPRSVIVEEPAPELIVRGSTAPPAA
jgi:DNA-binding LacI/PurR family transcriptional regulator